MTKRKPSCTDLLSHFGGTQQADGGARDKSGRLVRFRCSLSLVAPFRRRAAFSLAVRCSQRTQADSLLLPIGKKWAGSRSASNSNSARSHSRPDRRRRGRRTRSGHWSRWSSTKGSVASIKGCRGACSANRSTRQLFSSSLSLTGSSSELESKLT